MTQKEMFPEVVKDESKAMMTATLTDLGISGQDLVIPRLMLMQNTSEYVGDDKAKLGDVVNSQTQEVVGGIASPVEFVPLKLFKTLMTYDNSQQPPKFMKVEPLNHSNERLPFDGEDQGIPVRRYHVFNFFVLLKSDLDAGEAFPCVVSFRSTSLNAGKQIATHLFKMAALKRLPYSQSLMLNVNKEKKETNTWAVFNIGKGNVLSEEHVAECTKWIGVLSSINYSVDEEPMAAAKPVVAPEVIGADSGTRTVY